MRRHDSKLARVRVLLGKLLRADSDLDAFCIDYFPSAHSHFATGLDRVQKVNILFEQVADPAAILNALQRQFPDDRRVVRLTSEFSTEDRFSAGGSRTILHGSVGLAILTVLPLSAWLLRQPWHHASAVQSCPTLQIDDVVVQPRSSDGQVVLNVIIRNAGAAPANTTRTDVHVLARQEERAPYGPSANYELLISGEHNELATPHLVPPGAVDHFTLRLGFPPAGPAHQYEAELRVGHTGDCVATSRRFFFSSQSSDLPGSF